MFDPKPRLGSRNRKLVRYAKGERFAPHWDGYEGRISSSGFCDSSRIVTVFAYLTSVPPGGGGEVQRQLARARILLGALVSTALGSHPRDRRWRDFSGRCGSRGGSQSRARGALSRGLRAGE